jgi:BlaI family transcriptional regulator, penicillinase repressor
MKPSDYELKLLKYLWHHKRLSAREIHDASQAETSWSFSATRKTLERMVEKGLLQIEAVHGVKTFVASQSKLETLAALVSDFARNVLDTTAPMPAATFAHSRLISKDEIAELETLLEKLADDREAE